MKKNIITLSIINLLALGIWIGLFGYTHGQASKLGADYLALAEENEKEVYVTATSRDLRETENEQAELESLFVHVGGEAAFLEQVENLGSLAGVSLKVFTFEKRDKSLRVVLEGSGSFYANYYYLKLLETMPFYVTIDKSMFTKESTGEGSIWKGRHDFTLKSYYEN
ncbi:MAG: hypothetical protein AAB590_00770 [Patescibacteria group bacterium]